MCQQYHHHRHPCRDFPARGAADLSVVHSVTTPRDVIEYVDRSKDFLGLLINKGFIDAERSRAQDTLMLQRHVCDAEARLADRLSDVRRELLKEACDTREKVMCEGDRTRALIAAIDRDRLRDLVVELKGKNSNLRQTNILAGLIRDRCGHVCVEEQDSGCES